MSAVYKQVVYFFFQLIFFIGSGLLINLLLLQIGKCSVSCRRAFYKKNKQKTSKKTPQNKKQKHVVDVHIQMKKYLGWV